MSFEKQSREWPAVVDPVVTFVNHVERNLPVRLLRNSIIGLLAINTSLVGFEATSNDKAAMDMVQPSLAACGGVCEVGVSVEVQPSPILITPKKISTGPASIKMPVPAKTKEAVRQKRLRREPLRSQLEHKIDIAPTLEDLAKLLPVHYADWQKQLAYIEQLDKTVHVTPADYKSFYFNDSFRGAFKGYGEYDTNIKPQLIVPHWTVDRYPHGQAGGKRFADSLRNKGLSSNYLVSHTVKDVFRYYDSDTRQTAGGLGLNDKAIHIEIEAGLPSPEAMDPTVIFDITPGQIEQTIITVVKLARRYDLAISKYTVIEHLRADLLLVNKSYNPRLGTFDKLRKFDVTPDLTMVIIKKAAELDRQLG